MDLVAGHRQFEVWLVSLDPTQGFEIRKNRPCVVISPDEMNQYLQTVIIAPMTTASRMYPTRVGLTFHRKKGQIALDQIRTVDRQRLVKKLGSLSTATAQTIADVLVEMFTKG